MSRCGGAYAFAQDYERRWTGAVWKPVLAKFGACWREARDLAKSGRGRCGRTVRRRRAAVD